MKTTGLAFLSFLVLGLSALYADSYLTMVPPTAIPVAPLPGPFSYPIAEINRSTNVMGLGSMAKVNGLVYTCIATGTTASTVPTYATGDLLDGTVLWRPNLPHPRSGFYASVNSPLNSFFWAEREFTTNGTFIAKALPLYIYGPGCPQGAIWMRSVDGATSGVTFIEW